MSDVDLIRTMLALAEQEKEVHPDRQLERCGVIVERGDTRELIECANVSTEPHQQFRIAALEWARLIVDEKVVAVWHTHPTTPAEPTQADLVYLERTGLPWHIVSGLDQSHSLTLPTGYVAPYEGREFYHGTLDCYALCRDWYKRELGIDLPDVDREYLWWNKGANLYIDQFKQHGFVEVAPEVDVKNLRRGDGLLMQVASRVPNHGAIYLGDGKILHHVQDKLSEITNYGGDWFKRTTHHLRHSSQL
jgi:cell wall-associated NlpC family hydrolase